MPQDPAQAFALAIITGLFIVVGAVFGTRAAATINARANERIAALNARTAKDIETIKAEAQRTLERDKDHRQWRRERAAPALATMEKMWGLTVQARALQPGIRDEAWTHAHQLLTEAEDHALVASLQATSFIGGGELSNALISLVGVWEKWTYEYRQFIETLERGEMYRQDPRNDWDWKLTEARGALHHAFAYIDKYVYGDDPEALARRQE
jgi:hypothetical protein